MVDAWRSGVVMVEVGSGNGGRLEVGSGNGGHLEVGSGNGGRLHVLSWYALTYAASRDEKNRLFESLQDACTLVNSIRRVLRDF